MSYDEDIDPVELPFGLGSVDYTQYTNRQLAAGPLALLALALLVLLVWALVVQPTGVPVVLGIDFTGGTEMTVTTTDSPGEIREAFETPPDSIRSVGGQPNTYIVTFQSTDTTALENEADDEGYEVRSIQGTSAVFGERSQTQALFGVGIAFLGMAGLVFLLFRTFVPSIAVVVSAFSDMIVPLAVMDLLGIKLSLGTVAALLMLIGYSVDSDILFNNHVLRRRGTFHESAYRAMRTGVTMTLTSIAAMVVMTAAATFFRIDLLAAIGTVLMIGLTVDLFNTYLLNFSLLRWYKYEGVAR